MEHYQRIVERLRREGCRLTPQRLLILETLARGLGHMGVDEIFRAVRQSYPYVDIATVYRTLHLFNKLEVVTEVAIEDKKHYELTDPERRHHHMVCKRCGEAFDLRIDYLEGFRTTLVQEFKFEPDLENFTVSGNCVRCLDIDPFEVVDA